MDRLSLAALLLLAPGCGRSGPDCPPESGVDVVRAQAVLAVARGTPAGRGIADGAAICFGGRDRGAVLPNGVMVISSALDEAAAAARLIHLQIHVAEDLHRFPKPGVPCERQLAEMEAGEARAITAEIEACEALRCAAPPYSFAGEVLATAPDERVARVRARVHDAPQADGLDAMLRRYRARCEAAQ